MSSDSDISRRSVLRTMGAATGTVAGVSSMSTRASAEPGPIPRWILENMEYRWGPKPDISGYFYVGSMERGEACELLGDLCLPGALLQGGLSLRQLAKKGWSIRAWSIPWYVEAYFTACFGGGTSCHLMEEIDQNIENVDVSWLHLYIPCALIPRYNPLPGNIDSCSRIPWFVHALGLPPLLLIPTRN